MKKISGGFTDYITVDWVEAAAADRDDISHLFGSIEIYAFLNQIRLKSYRVILMQRSKKGRIAIISPCCIAYTILKGKGCFLIQGALPNGR